MFLSFYDYNFVFNRREDCEPSKHSRVCSCHFRDGQKANGPQVYDRNKNKLFAEQRGPPSKKKKKAEPKKCLLPEIIDITWKNEQPSTYDADIEENVPTKREVILEAELDLANRELKGLEGELQYKSMRYTVARLEEDVTRMKTGLPTKKVFNIVVNYALRFKDSINYFVGWNVELIKTRFL